MDGDIEILAVVPARAGSKGIPRKNLQQIHGRTLIARACATAAACPSVTYVTISSDDPDMGAEGVAHGAHTFIERPPSLAHDEATSADAWQHAWRHAESAQGMRFDVSVWLQPTSPSRTVDDVERTISAVVKGHTGSAVTVSPVPSHFAPEKQLVLTDEGSLAAYVSGGVPNVRRQDLARSYWLNGHCYAARRHPFLEAGVVITPDTAPVVVDRPTVNIDEPFDLELARWMLS